MLQNEDIWRVATVIKEPVTLRPLSFRREVPRLAWIVSRT